MKQGITPQILQALLASQEQFIKNKVPIESQIHFRQAKIELLMGIRTWLDHYIVEMEQHTEKPSLARRSSSHGSGYSAARSWRSHWSLPCGPWTRIGLCIPCMATSCVPAMPTSPSRSVSSACVTAGPFRPGACTPIRRACPSSQ